MKSPLLGSTLARHLLLASAVTFICSPIANAAESASSSQLQTIHHINMDQRASSIGSIFTRNTSNLALGEAYTDPSGLIWGATARDAQGQIRMMNQQAAVDYCKTIGARLPTIYEFVQLTKYRGADNFSADGNCKISKGKWCKHSINSYEDLLATNDYGLDKVNTLLVLPGIAPVIDLKPGEFGWYWTSTDDDDGIFFWGFSGVDGELRVAWNFRGPVICVSGQSNVAQ